MGKKKHTSKGRKKGTPDKQQHSNNNNEHGGGHKHASSKKQNQHHHQHQHLVIEDDRTFRWQLEKDKTRKIHEMAIDGNCLFRSLSDQLHNDYGQRHDEVRGEVCNFMVKKEEQFKGFVVLDDDDEDNDNLPEDDIEEHASSYEEYIERMRRDGEWGGNPELAAAAQFYRRDITVYSSVGAYSIPSGNVKNSGVDLWLSYHENDHYNSVEDLRHGRSSSSGNSKNRREEAHTNDTQQHHHPKQYRNRPCACGSGLKYKHCCLANVKHDANMERWRGANNAGGIDDDDVQNGTAQGKRRSNGDACCEIDGDFQILKI